MEAQHTTSPSGTPASHPVLTVADRRLGQYLLEHRILAADGLKKTIDLAAREGLSFQDALLKLMLVTQDVLDKLPADLTSEPQAMAPGVEPGAPATVAAAVAAAEPIAAPPAQASAPAARPGALPVRGRKMLGDYLVEQGVLSTDQLGQALKCAKDKNIMLGAAIVALNYMSESALSEYLVKHQLAQKKSQSKQRRLKLGEILIEQGVLPKEKLDEALEHAKKSRMRLGEAVTALGLAREQDVTMALSRQLCLPLVNLTRNPPDPALLTKIPRQLCEKHQAIPFRLEGKVLTAAMVDPLNIIAIDDFQNMTGNTVLPVLCAKSDFERALIAFYGAESGDDLLEVIKEAAPEIASGDAEANAAPIIMLVNKIISLACEKGASDIHFDPNEEGLMVRFRVDGILRDMKMKIPREAHAAITSRMKVMCSLDIAETRLPQDGKFRLKVSGKIIDFRVSLIPIVWGEKIVIRLLDQSKARATIDDLGLDPYSEKIFRPAVRTPNGIVLVTGPTGSGKSTTLYAAMLELNEPTVNIHTIEDPVEFTLPGITQVSVKGKLSFAAALRSFLRQDPDVIIVGEIRDSETASIALKSAMTGHTVLSTLHTNDAISTIDRLVTMKMDRFLIASALRCVLAQRLVRKLCLHCRQSSKMTDEEVARWAVTPYMMEQAGFPGKEPQDLEIFRPKGCDQCSDGYKGRVGVYEVLGVDTRIKEMIVEGASNKEVWTAARDAGLLTLRDSGVIKVLKGLSSFEEVVRISVTPPSSKRREAYNLLATDAETAEASTATGAGGGLSVLDRQLLEGLATRLETLGGRTAGEGKDGAGANGVDLREGVVRAGNLAAQAARVLASGNGAAAEATPILGQLTALLDQLATFGQSPPAAIEVIDLAEWLPRTVEELRPDAVRRAEYCLGTSVDVGAVKISTAVDPKAPLVLADPGFLRTCLLELVSNSVAALAGGGSVRVLTKAVAQSPGLVEFCVVDNGPGIDPALLPHVSRPYVTGGGHGLGLGLATAQRLVGILGGGGGGGIDLVSKAGKGCMARLRLRAPTAAPSAQASTQAAGGEQTATSPGSEPPSGAPTDGGD